jgi:hypothetical protein
MSHHLASQMTQAEFDSPVKATQALKGAMAMCKEPTAAKIRTRYRDPWEIKGVRQMLENATCELESHGWHKKLIAAKVAHLSLCNQRKIADEVRDGGVVQRRSNLRPLTRMVAEEDERRITSSREILKVVADVYASTWFANEIDPMSISDELFEQENAFVVKSDHLLKAVGTVHRENRVDCCGISPIALSISLDLHALARAELLTTTVNTEHLLRALVIQGRFDAKSKQGPSTRKQHVLFYRNQ